jgi:4-amino-4-deoxy-L-arabinose transferase-like glycosyltransferase
MSRRALLICLLTGLVIRIAILWQTPELGPRITDEQHYVELAGSLTAGRGFAWSTGELTSLRPPLYPAMIASIWRVTHTGDLQTIRVVQMLISLLTTFVVYDLGRRVFSARVGSIAAVVTWLYPSLVYVNFALLTETLFTAWLMAFVWLSVVLVERPRPLVALACGVVLGLGALTRSVLWPFPLLLCPLLVLMLQGSWPRRLAMPALVLAGFAAVITPWAIRNTRLQHVTTIVDTMGGMNLRMGNYEYTPEDRIWDAVSLKGEKNWVYALTQEPPGPPPPGGVFTEGMKDKWAQRKAIAYIKAHPGTFIRRAFIKFGDFWGLERSYAAGVQQGLYHPSRVLAAMAIAAMLVSYVALSLSGVAGFWLAGIRWRPLVLMLLPVLALVGAHTIVFGHERYHLPLVPILALFAAAVWIRLADVGWRGIVASLATTPRGARWTMTGAVCSMLVLSGIWVRQLVFVDGEKLRALMHGLW